MDELRRLADMYGARVAASAKPKLDVLMNLETSSDPRIVPFLRQMLWHRQGSDEVRMYVVKHWR